MMTPTPMTKVYELFYLIGESRKGDWRTIDTDVHGIVERFGGTFLPKQVTEERRLAYPIAHERRGLYVAARFTLPDRDARDEAGTEAPAESPITAMHRELGLYQGVLRVLIVDATDLPPLATKEERETLAREAKQALEVKRGKKASNEDMEKQLTQALNI